LTIEKSTESTISFQPPINEGSDLLKSENGSLSKPIMNSQL